MDEKRRAAEIRFGELLLAANDMQQTMALIDRVPAKRSRLNFALDLIGIVASYSRPFKRNNRNRVVGTEFLKLLSEAQRKLHDKIIDLRDQDHAHSDLYDGRVCIGPRRQGSIVIDSVLPTSDVTFANIRMEPEYSTGTRVISRRELFRLRAIAANLDGIITTKAWQLGAHCILRRVGEGSVWFKLGVDGDSPPPPKRRRYPAYWLA